MQGLGFRVWDSRFEGFGLLGAFWEGGPVCRVLYARDRSVAYQKLNEDQCKVWPEHNDRMK